MQDILIISKSSVSALGHDKDSIWKKYQSKETAITMCCFNDRDTPTAKLHPETEDELQHLRKENNHYRRLDKSVLLGIMAGRQALKQSGWNNFSNVGINMGSSRGATQLFEKYHRHFIESPNDRMTPLVSPTTTLGNIASWLAFDLGTQGATLSHSITCSTALHSILNACIWIKSETTERFIAGGSEAPLSDFTIAQMRALGIYTKNNKSEWPCSPLKDSYKSNTMVLGEGSAVFCLEKNKGQESLAKIVGLGYATEHIKHPASLSADADCIRKSMQMALEDSRLSEVDAIVMHAPGTTQGDKAELKAIKTVFGENSPHLISTKHHSGHTFGASGGLSLDLAIDMLNKQSLIAFPYSTDVEQKNIAPKSIMVNAIGFGGNAVSIIVQKTD
ncbi:MAG: beta-ketoacyl synthase N-terminal-like domain-containing protein [Flavobacteriales bacterium]